MDILTCAGLALAETFLAGKSPGKFQIDLPISAAFLLFVGQYLALKFYRICLYPHYFSPLRHIPGPKDGHWLFGQGINLLKAPGPTTLQIEWMRQFPDAPFIRYFSFFNTEVLLANSPNTWRELLHTSCYSTRKSDWYIRAGRDVIGNGLVAHEGEKHRVHRKMLSAPFSVANIRKLEPLFKDKAKELSAILHTTIERGQDGGQTGIINTVEIFTRLFLDIIGVATLGRELSQLDTVHFENTPSYPNLKMDHNRNDSADEEWAPFRTAYHEFFSPQDKWKQLLLFVNGYFPIRWLPIQANREFKSTMRSLHELMISLIRERFVEIRSAALGGKVYEKSSSRDLLTFIVEESLPGGSAEGIQEDVLMGDTQYGMFRMTDGKAQLLEFMAAGHETSANILSWSILVLARNHEIQEKLRAEIRGLVSRETDPSYVEIEKLRYLDNLIKEVLRVYPPAHTLYRQATEDLNIEGVFIPKDTRIDFCACLPQLNPFIWGDDADIVDPDRWEGLAATDKRLSPFVIGAWSNGPRICLGKSFALLELKIIFIELIRNFRFLSVENELTLANPSLVLQANRLDIKLERAVL